MENGSMLGSVAATVAAPEARIEIVGERRRVHDAAFRARVVEECSVPGARMRDLARRHGLCISLIYRWRRSARPPETVVAAVRPDAAGPVRPGKATVAGPPLEFVPIGVLERSEDGGPGLVAGSSPAGVTLSSPGHASLPRPVMDERPGVIEIDLVDGTRLRVDAFVNERALRRVLTVLRTAS
jgi:transposase